MKVKRISKIKINSSEFSIKWDDSTWAGFCSYAKLTIMIGTKQSEAEIFATLCHEIMELIACEMFVRFNRGDCSSDYIFVYDHRQHTTMMSMFAGIISQFIK